MKNKNLLNSFKYAFKGFVNCFKRERNMKIHVLMILFVTLLGIFLKISRIEWIICIILFMLILSAEMVNTSMEIVVDMVCPNKNKMAGQAKDIVAASVLILAIGAAIIGIIIFVPKIILLF